MRPGSPIVGEEPLRRQSASTTCRGDRFGRCILCSATLITSSLTSYCCAYGVVVRNTHGVVVNPRVVDNWGVVIRASDGNWGVVVSLGSSRVPDDNPGVVERRCARHEGPLRLVAN